MAQPAVKMVSGLGSRLPAIRSSRPASPATASKPRPSPRCPTSARHRSYTSSLVSIPAPNTGDDDKNPPRIAPRNLFDASVGEDNLFNGDKYKWSLRLTGVNITNKYALYNFLSTFSGTHYVTPRALTAEIGFHF